MRDHLRKLFQKQQDLLLEFFKQLDINQAENIYNVIKNCKGTLFFSGVGKSGYIAEKIAATFVSVGKKAHFLSPQNAVHGDLGILTQDDVVVLLSKSGETKELVDLIPFLKNKQVTTVCWVCKASSPLQSLCDFSVLLPVDEEICVHNLAPTTSTAAQLIFGDVLAVAVSKSYDFSLDEYAKNHPCGNIGKQITLTVENLMLKDDELPVCQKDMKLKDALFELSNKKCGCIVVVDDEKHALGVFTDGDLRRAFHNHPENALEKTMEELMTKTFLHISKNALLLEALRIMQENKNKWVATLPVLNERKLVGLVRMHDIVNANI